MFSRWDLRSLVSLWVGMGRAGHNEWVVVNYRFSKYNQIQLLLVDTHRCKCKADKTHSTSPRSDGCWEALGRWLLMWEIHGKLSISLSREDEAVRIGEGGFQLKLLLILSELHLPVAVLWSGPEAHDSTVRITVPVWRFRMATACSWVTPSRVSPLTAKIWSPRFNWPSSAAAPYKQETFQFNPGWGNSNHISNMVCILKE